MKWWRFLAKIYDKLNLKIVILDRERNLPYLTRYYIFSTRFMENIFPKLSYRLVLHNVHLSDVDGLHSHPWHWGSKILEGGYWERIQSNNGVDRIWHDSTSGWRFNSPEFLHRLELDQIMSERKTNSKETWTLFLMGPRIKDWGFIDDTGTLIPHEQWFEIRRKRLKDNVDIIG